MHSISNEIAMARESSIILWKSEKLIKFALLSLSHSQTGENNVSMKNLYTSASFVARMPFNVYILPLFILVDFLLLFQHHNLSILIFITFFLLSITNFVMETIVK